MLGWLRRRQHVEALREQLDAERAEREAAARRLAEAERQATEVTALTRWHRTERARNHIADDLDRVLGRRSPGWQGE